MKRNCHQCKKNITFPPRFGCGYLPEKERQHIEYDIEELEDPSFNMTVCPIFTYNENVFIYDFINDAKTMSADKLTFPGRYALKTYNDFISLLIESKTKPKTTKIGG